MKFLKLFFLVLIVQSCATYKPQYHSQSMAEPVVGASKIEHTFFLVGDAGNGMFQDSILHFEGLRQRLKRLIKTVLYFF